MPEKIINYIPADKFFELFEYKKVDVQKVIPGFVPGGGVMLMSPAFQSTPTTITTNEQENKSVTYFDQVQFKSTEPPSPPPSLTQSVAANNVCTIKLGSFDSTNFQHTNKNFVTTKCLNSNQGSERTEEEGVKDNDDVTDAIDLLESIEADSDAACLNVSPIVSSFVSPSFDACLDAETDESLSDSGLDEDMYHEMRREDCRKTARSHWYKKEEPRLEKCYLYDKFRTIGILPFVRVADSGHVSVDFGCLISEEEKWQLGNQKFATVYDFEHYINEYYQHDKSINNNNAVIATTEAIAPGPDDEKEEDIEGYCLSRVTSSVYSEVESESAIAAQYASREREVIHNDSYSYEQDSTDLAYELWLEKLAANEDRAAEIEKDEEIVIDTFDPEEQGIPSSAQVLSYAHGEPSFEEMESDTSHVGDPEEHPIPTASQVLCYTHVSNRSPQNEEMVNETFHVDASVEEVEEGQHLYEDGNAVADNETENDAIPEGEELEIYENPRDSIYYWGPCPTDPNYGQYFLPGRRLINAHIDHTLLCRRFVPDGIQIRRVPDIELPKYLESGTCSAVDEARVLSRRKVKFNTDLEKRTITKKEVIDKRDYMIPECRQIETVKVEKRPKFNFGFVKKVLKKLKFKKRDKLKSSDGLKSCLKKPKPKEVEGAETETETETGLRRCHSCVVLDSRKLDPTQERPKMLLRLNRPKSK